MSTSSTILHIVEPTLADQAGHCYGYVRSLVKANKQFDLQVWIDRRGRTLFQNEPCRVHPYFFRKLRKLQKIFCLYRLLKSKKNIFIPTAGRADMVILNWLLGKSQHSRNIFLHFHQFRVTSKKIELLKKIAARHPEFIILAPTQKIVNIFKNAGFLQCLYVPCPGYEPNPKLISSTGKFEKLVYAGAARSDKGFPKVVEFVEYLQKEKIEVLVELQVSPPFSGRYDQECENALFKLKQFLPNQNLILQEDTLDLEGYQQLFNQSIALLLYDRNSYHNKFSGVAFDAFSAGCPVIAMVDTWAGDVVERFEAGVVIADDTPQKVYEAFLLIRERYQRYHKNALRAGRVLQKEHDPSHTLAVIQAQMGSS